MRILFLTDNFPPEVNAPASRTFEHCREWARAGHDVTVITCAPNFPKGKVFEGYRNRIFSRETMDGIQVVRVWTYITANEGFLRRTLDYVSFMLAAAPASLRVARPDVVIATSPQFFTACAGYLVGKLRRAPFVFELRDMWPESIRVVGAMQQPALLDWLERIELFLYRNAAMVVPVTNSFKRKLVERGIDAARINVVTNGADLAHFRPRGKDTELTGALGLSGKFVAGYIGTHGLAHGLETLLEAARLLQEEGRDDIRLLFLGDGASKASLREHAAQLDLKNVIFLDTVAKSDVVRYWSLLDVSIIHLRKTDLFTTVIPSKLFECMAMGIPVLHGVRGESAEIVESEKVGTTFEPENAKDLHDKLVALSEDRSLVRALGRNGVKAARKFDRTHLAEQMLRLIENRVLGREAPRGEKRESIKMEAMDE
jgi:glycosyltransferase involved in cell wall biosynthesis